MDLKLRERYLAQQAKRKEGPSNRAERRRIERATRITFRLPYMPGNGRKRVYQ